MHYDVTDLIDLQWSDVVAIVQENVSLCLFTLIPILGHADVTCDDSRGPSLCIPGSFCIDALFPLIRVLYRNSRGMIRWIIGRGEISEIRAKM